MSEQFETVQLYGSALDPGRQREAFRSGRVPVAVYGLGKMGLPLAAVYADHCGNVLGADPDPAVAESVDRGDCHVAREPGLPELVADVVDRGALSATTEPQAAAREAAVHVVIVPTLVTEDSDPDLGALEAVGRDIAAGLAPGDLVVVESTTPPRTVADAFVPLLERESGLSLGEFGAAVCPERTSSGRAVRDIRGSHPKVVGGADGESTRVATLIYDDLVDNEIVAVSDATTAEAVKVFEGIYRDVNIALANELAQFTDEVGIDVSEAIDAANTQPYCDIHDPGPGVGGHCIPYYPHFLTGPFDTPAPLIRTGRQVNDEMPQFVVDRLAAALAERTRAPGNPGSADHDQSIHGGEAADHDQATSETGATTATSPLDGATVLVLGLTYRAGVAETRAAPARGICAGIAARGGNALAVDPMLDDADSFDAAMIDRDDMADREVDVAVLVTAHEEFRTIDWDAFDPMPVVDTRRVLDLSDTDHDLYAIGRGRR